MAQMSLGNVLKGNSYNAKFCGKGEGLVSFEKGHGEDMSYREEVAYVLAEGQCGRLATVDSTRV